MNAQSFKTKVAILYGELERIQFYEEGTEFTFVNRLTSENGWRIKYAERVLAEYRRFLILVKLTDDYLIPSDAVDQAWHLHLIYSQSYWDELCGQILQKPLHHQPIDGTGKDRELFCAQYSRTLERYKEVFGEAAPVDIWPQARVRVAIANMNFQRVDMKVYSSKMARCKLFVYLGAAVLILLNAFFASIHSSFLLAMVYLMFINIAFAVNELETGETKSDGSCGGGGGGCGGGCGGG